MPETTPNLRVDSHSDKHHLIPNDDGFYDESAPRKRHCLACDLQFSTASEHSKHRNQHVKPYKCVVAGCDKAFSQRQQLDRHKLSQHDRCAKHYHCTTEGCKYALINEFGKAGAKFTREDHLKTHIKDYGHYGPFSPVNRKKRHGEEIQDAISVTVFFEECLPSGRMSGDCHRRITKQDIFESTKTKLWYRDEKGFQYIVGDSISATDILFYCCHPGCYYNQTPPEGVPRTAFRTLEQLDQHGRITGHGTSHEYEGNGQHGPVADEHTGTGARDGNTPLLSSSWSGYEAVVRLLLDEKTAVDAKDTSGQTSLYQAAGRWREAVVRLLLEKGADVDAEGGSGNTALRLAATVCHMNDERLSAFVKRSYPNLAQDRCLAMLPYANDAAFNSYSRQHNPPCLPNTRVDLLRQLMEWSVNTHDSCIFWLNGMAGTGKSTIARTLAQSFANKKRLGASFFFSRGHSDLGHAGKFFTTLALQLANTSSVLKEYIYKAVAEYNDIAHRSQRDQWNHLIVRPLSMLESNSCQSPLVLIIDALDECDNEEDVRVILQLFAEAKLLQPIQLRILITSRPETTIRFGFRSMGDIFYRSIVLHDISRTVVDNDIFVFFKHKLEDIRKASDNLPVGWPGRKAIDLLVLKSHGLFIYAATVCRFLGQGGEQWPLDDLLHLFLRNENTGDFLVGNASNTIITDEPPYKELDKMYTQILEHSFRGVYNKNDRQQLASIWRQVVGTIVVLFHPLPVIAIDRLLDVEGAIVRMRLRHLHSVLEVPDNQERPLRLLHPSFRDFLLDKYRCNDLRFWVPEKQAHRIVADNCIRLMSNSLKQDICGQEAPGALVASLESSRIEQYLPLEVRYACLYWIEHLQKSDSQLYDNDQVYQFFRVHLLHWLEALAWIGKTSEAILAILSLEAKIPAAKNPDLYAFIQDAKRFALYNRSVIEQAPLQLYCSALVFAPEKSIIRRQFKKDIPPWIQMQPKVQTNWNAALQTLEGHLGFVTSVTFSPDSKLIASGSGDMTVRLWDAVTGAALQTLKGHLGSVRSVAFSPESKVIVSGSDDQTIRLWDTITGAALQTLEGHLGSVESVAFSLDSKVIISGSDDQTVRLWDAIIGAALRTLEGHSGPVESVAFSPDGKLVISGSADMTVRFWDAITGAALQTLEGHLGSVKSVAFSLDNKIVVSGSDDQTIKLWDAVTGAVLQTLVGHSDPVESVAFSLDSKIVVSGSGDQTVRLWDAVTGAVLQTLEGHSGLVKSVAFSTDSRIVVSGSDDKTVRLWDTVVGAALQTPEGHSGPVKSVAFSLDGKLVISGSGDKTVRLWDTVTGAGLRMLKGHLGSVESVAFSSDGKLAISGSWDMTVRLWDAMTGAALQTLKGHSGPVESVSLSPDSKLAVSGSWDMTVRLWDAMTGAALQTLEGHSDSVESVAFSPDSKVVVSGSADMTVRLWDAITGAALQTLEGHLDSVRSVAFLPNSKVVVSGSDDHTIKLWDAVTGAALQTLEGHSDLVESVAFSPDGRVAIPSLWDRTVTFDISSDSLEQLHGLFVSNDWVVERSGNFLWLPPDYRGSCVAIWKRIIVLGHSSGGISFLEFKQGPKLI